MKKETWTELVMPVVVLMVICLITSALLAGTNSVTAPIISANEEAAANAAYAAALPEAEGQFEDVLDQVTVAGVTAAKKATNGAGYCLQAVGKGYGGDVPVILALDPEGNVLACTFMQNSESAGFGMKLWDGSADGLAFAESIVGKSGSVALKQDGVDGLAGATISSKAAVDAVNACLAGFAELNG